MGLIQRNDVSGYPQGAFATVSFSVLMGVCG